MITQDYTKQKIAIRAWMEGRGFHVAIAAMNFAEKYHTGTRKDGKPEFSHQVSQANGWVYEKVCLDELQIMHNADSKLSYTPCYNQYGKVAQMFA